MVMTAWWSWLAEQRLHDARPVCSELDAVWF